MYHIIRRIKEAKKIYKEHLAVVESLPEDYQFVFRKMNEYIWSFAGGTGMDTLQTEYELAKLFAETSENGLSVLEVTGRDVAGFCDALIRDNKSWMDSSRKRLNAYISKTNDQKDGV